MMLIESDVIRAVMVYLERAGHTIQSHCNENQRGHDIDGLTSEGSRILIEAKGETSSKASSKRYGQAFDSKQVNSHVSKAFTRAASHFSTGVLSGIALPKSNAHLEAIQQIRSALEYLEIEVFWVLSDQTVEVAGYWKT
jgi:hypothetical protein